MNNLFKNLAIWLVIGVVLMTVFNQFNNRQTAQNSVEYSQFMEDAKQGKISKAVVDGRTVRATTQDGRVVTVYTPGVQDIWMVGDLMRYGVKVTASKPEEEQSFLMNIFVSWFPMILLIGVWVFFMRQMQGGGRGGAFSFGKSKAKMLDESANTVTFADVAGCDEAKEEVGELVDFLRDPSKFQKLGGHIPKGVLMVGSPGTGKTLLAKAIAGEAKVPFFSISGSDFVEMFVGVGASRVRDLFEQAKQNSPCIIFMDEIDAVGRHRGAGLGGGHDEREQTLNQLLVEMDGFESNEGVIMVAATNRPDVLDPALLRPGRFDRQVVVDWPDVRGREGILKVHTRKIPLSEDVDLKAIARSTPGMAGAELANIVNEAALLAARRNHKKVSDRDFEDAKDKVMLGTERRSLVMTEEERKTTAYHEAGHALVAWLIPGSDPVTKVTIIPRGRALGVTFYTPQEERHNHSKKQLEDRLCHAMGGRAAEILIFDHLTTGAVGDLEMASNIARNMVTRYGMSEKLGPLAFGKSQDTVFLGRELGTHKDYSEQTAVLIDNEVRQIVERAHEKAVSLLRGSLDKLHLLANTLLERETLDGDEMDRVLRGEKLEPLNRGDSAGPSADAPVTSAPAESGGGQLDAFGGDPEPNPA